MEVPPTVACHVVAMPYPGRGHINPMMNFCKLLVSKGTNILVTFVVTDEWLGLIGSEPKADNIQLTTIPNVIPSEMDRCHNLIGFIEAVMTKMETPLVQLLDRLEKQPTVIIYDTFLFWVVAVGSQRNIPVASFWPPSASALSLRQHHHLLEQNGDYPVKLSENGNKRVDYIPGISSIRLADISSIDGSLRSRQLWQWLSKGIQWVPKAQYLLLPSIYELEIHAVDVLKKKLALPIYTIGPTIPYFSFADNSSVCIDRNTDHSYLQWLDKQPPKSVLYISQGSFLSVSSAQIDEIAAGLRISDVRFLWAARGESYRLKEICGNKGLVLEWCDQPRVLLHPAVGGFWSHCGWNSTKEGVFAGVPFLTFPIGHDQLLNSKLIVEDWKVGWRVKNEVTADTLVRTDAIASLLPKFMDLEGGTARGLRQRATELQQICQNAIANGGSAETDINAFVRDILQAAKPKP